MTRNPLQRLADFGQSVWLDYIERSFVRGGELATLAAANEVLGVTSNPAIFHKAIVDHDVYDEAIAALARAGRKEQQIFEALVVEDIRAAADVLAAVHERTGGRDGFVSLEVSPQLALDATGTCAEARRLWSEVGRRNLMIKVPGTEAGVAAIQELIADGINVNVTLLFSVERYAMVADAYLSGLERRRASGAPVDHVASVASFFLSRIDTFVDEHVRGSDDAQLRALQGQLAILSARAAYQQYVQMTRSARWKALQARGARPQRLLWASTSAKDPAYSDVKYVEPLIGPDTVTTLPPETLTAYRDHGQPALRLTDIDNALAALEHAKQRLGGAGVDWSSLMQRLERDGVAKFIQPYNATLDALRERLTTKGA